MIPKGIFNQYDILNEIMCLQAIENLHVFQNIYIRKYEKMNNILFSIFFKLLFPELFFISHLFPNFKHDNKLDIFDLCFLPLLCITMILFYAYAYTYNVYWNLVSTKISSTFLKILVFPRTGSIFANISESCAIKYIALSFIII
jgi:hypothetical protein